MFGFHPLGSASLESGRASVMKLLFENVTTKLEALHLGLKRQLLQVRMKR